MRGFVEQRRTGFAEPKTAEVVRTVTPGTTLGGHEVQQAPTNRNEIRHMRLIETRATRLRTQWLYGSPRMIVKPR